MSLANKVLLDLTLYLESIDGEIEYPSFVSQLRRAKNAVEILTRHILVKTSRLVLNS